LRGPHSSPSRCSQFDSPVIYVIECICNHGVVRFSLIDYYPRCKL
jgi:hypothetical protein